MDDHHLSIAKRVGGLVGRLDGSLHGLEKRGLSVTGVPVVLVIQCDRKHGAHVEIADAFRRRVTTVRPRENAVSDFRFGGPEVPVELAGDPSVAIAYRSDLLGRDFARVIQRAEIVCNGHLRAKHLYARKTPGTLRVVSRDTWRATEVPCDAERCVPSTGTWIANVSRPGIAKVMVPVSPTPAPDRSSQLRSNKKWRE